MPARYFHSRLLKRITESWSRVRTPTLSTMSSKAACPLLTVSLSVRLPRYPGRFRLLAAGGVRIRGASALLFERGTCVLSGGQDIPRVKGAPVSEHRQGYRCTAPASSQPGYRGRRTERRLAETKLPSISSSVSKPRQAMPDQTTGDKPAICQQTLEHNSHQKRAYQVGTSLDKRTDRQTDR